MTSTNPSKIDIEEEAPILHYLPIRGIAQPIRNLLYYFDVDFKEVNYTTEEEYMKNLPENKACFYNSLPSLEHNGKVISEITSICRYLCQRYEKENLLGLTPQKQVQS